MEKRNLREILGVLTVQGINEVTFNAHTFDEEYSLGCDDKDYVIFHRSINPPIIVVMLSTCDYDTTQEPIWKDWYMTICYHP